MKNLKRKNHKSQSGFTMLEIIVVLALIGGIMALVAANITGKGDEARAEQARIGATELISSIETYRIRKRKIPESLDTLGLKEDKTIDPWGNKYVLRKPGSNSAYEVMSYGADGKEGGEGVNEDITLP